MESYLSFNYEYNSYLEFYIRYEYLPVEQYSNILSSINNIYESLTSIYLHENSTINTPVRPLIIDYSYTGNSITFKIKILDQEAEIQVDRAPKWASYLIFASILIGVSHRVYEGYLSTQKIRKEIENLDLENQNLRQELRQKDLNKLSDEGNPKVRKLIKNLKNLNTEIRTKNIQYVELNGLPIKRESDNNSREQTTEIRVPNK